MRIAKDIHGNPIECNGTTDPNQIYTCFICGGKVYPCNKLKIEDERKKGYYFAHYNNNCSHSVETYKHRIAKVIIERSNKILFPDKMLTYTNAESECTTFHTSLRPDVLLGKEFVIEICCTNKKTKRQIEIYKQLNITAVEIFLDSLDMNCSLEEIEYAVLYEPHNRFYLSQKQEGIVHSETASENQFETFVKIVLVVLCFFAFAKWLNHLTARQKYANFAKKNKHGANRHYSYQWSKIKSV